jgi:hypothetical protein
MEMHFQIIIVLSQRIRKSVPAFVQILSATYRPNMMRAWIVLDGGILTLSQVTGV